MKTQPWSNGIKTLEDRKRRVENTYLLGVVDTLQVKSSYIGTVQGSSSVIFVARKDLSLKICTYRMHLIPPAGNKITKKVGVLLNEFKRFMLWSQIQLPLCDGEGSAESSRLHAAA